MISERSEDFSHGATLGREVLIFKRSEDFSRRAILGQALIFERVRTSVTEMMGA